MRYWSIDVLRGLAILLMIQVHFVGNLSSREQSSAALYDTSVWLGHLPAPLFTFVSGVSYCLWLRKQKAQRRPDGEITKISLRRGLFLFGAGIAFNVFVWLPEETFIWDILTLIGASLAIMAFARKIPRGVLAFICLLVLLLSPLMREACDYGSYWEDYVYVYDFTLFDLISGFFVNGYFPLFPWIVFPLLGFVVGDAVFPRFERLEKQRRPEKPARWVAGTGISLVLLSAVFVLFHDKFPAVIREHYLTGFSMYPASTEHLLGMAGLCLVSLAGLHRCLDLNPRIAGTGRCLKFMRLFSSFSLTVYLLHHAVHLWPVWIYGASQGLDPTFYWQHVTTTPIAMILALAFIAVCYFVLKYLDRRGGHGFEALMRWLCG